MLGFCDNEARVANRPVLDEEIDAVFGKLSRDQVVGRLRAADIAFGAVNSVADLAAHPQLRRAEVRLPGGVAELVAPPASFADETRPLGPVPALDEHGAAIRRGVRGVSAERERWRDWIGREQTAEDVLDAGRARALQATLDDTGKALEAGDPLPPLWHWIYFWTVAPPSMLGPDGHPERGGFLPPIELPRRMWAGSRVTFHRPLPVGAAAARRSRIKDVRITKGRNGRLAFVTVRHEITADGEPSIEDEHDIVYRAAPRPGETPRPGDPAPKDTPWRHEITADPVLLFRYSALTFNGHRIHYDLKHATEVEDYPGLVVHGPPARDAHARVGARRASRGDGHGVRIPGDASGLRHRALHRGRPAGRGRQKRRILDRRPGWDVGDKRPGRVGLNSALRAIQGFALDAANQAARWTLAARRLSSLRARNTLAR